jgi:hypothetical protein
MFNNILCNIVKRATCTEKLFSKNNEFLEMQKYKLIEWKSTVVDIDKVSLRIFTLVLVMNCNSWQIE